jgi:hypothetical protein
MFEPLLSRYAALIVMQVVGSVFGGKGDEEFWEWRKQAQTGGISSLNTELTYGEFDLDLFGKLLALSGDKTSMLHETIAASQTRERIGMLVGGGDQAVPRPRGRMRRQKQGPYHYTSTLIPPFLPCL